MVHAFNPRQRQVHLYEFEAILAHEEFQGSRGYTERPCLSSIKNITNFLLSIMTDVDSRLPTPHLVPQDGQLSAHQTLTINYGSP